MSDKTNPSTASSEAKHASPDDDTGSKRVDTQNAPSSGGHEETGVEKFASTGGSGGQPMRTGQGFEHLAQHQ
ncbi:unnamed protein product [Adineta ricciae]|nr:unnamed protein product [Adineta ricciae]